MGLNSIDTKINLNSSNFTSGMKQASGGVDGFYKSLQKIDKAKVKLDGISKSTLALAEAYRDLGKVQDMFSDFLSGAYKYSTMMETNAVGISAILKSMVNVNGKTLQWNQSLAMSKDLMAKLRVEALQTASTSEDLIDTFRGILGPALNQGMSIDETMDFTKIGVNAVRSLGLPSNQYLQELRSILQGNIKPASSTLATALGISNQDIKNAKNEVGGVYKFLMDKMDGFVKATDETANTVEGRIAIIKEGIYSTFATAGKDIFADYSFWLRTVYDRMFVLDEKTKKIDLNPDFVNNVSDVLGDFKSLGNVIQKIINGLMDRAGVITKFAEVFAVVKGGQWITNSIVNQINGFVEKFKVFDAFTKGDVFEKKIAEINEQFNTIVAKNKQLVSDNMENEKIINNISGGVRNLAGYYHSMGVETEQALKWQKEIEQSVLKGDYAGASSLEKKYEAQAKIKQQEKEQIELEKQKLANLDTEINRLEKIASLKRKQEKLDEEILGFMKGQAVYSKGNKDLGIKKGEQIDSKYSVIGLGVELKLAEQNVPLEERNKKIEKYIGLVKTCRFEEAETYAQSVIQASKSYQAKAKETEQIIQLSERERNEQQRVMMLYELKRRAVLTGDRYIVSATNDIVSAVEREAKAMQITGSEGSIAYKQLIDVIKQVINNELALDKTLVTQMKHFEEATKDAQKYEGKLKHDLISALTSVGGAITGVGFAFDTLKGSTEDSAGKIAEWCLGKGIVISACASMVDAVMSLKKAYDALAQSSALANLLKLGGSALKYIGGPAMLAKIALGLTAGGIGWSLYEGTKTTQAEKQQNLGKTIRQRNAEVTKKRQKDVGYTREELIEMANKQQALMEGMTNVAIEQGIGSDWQTGKVTVNGNENGGGGGGKGANKIEKLKQQADEAKKSYDELISTINVANAGKDESITEFGKKREELKNKLLQWNDKLDTLKKKGGEYSQISDDDVTKAKTLIEQYKLLETEEINRNEKIKEYANELQIIDNLETVGALSKREANKLRVESLQEEIAFYQQLASQEKLNADKRLEYETIIAEKRKALREAEATESKIQWDSVLEHIRNTSFNLTETFNNGIDGMIGRFTEFGQNIIGSTKSVTEQLRELCKNLASDILNMMMKIYMQGLMMNLIGNIFGGGSLFGKGSGSIGSTPSMLSSPSVNSIKGIGLSGIGVFANGGVASGWSIVGEKGPELVNFSNPGRVYTADQTRNALSGGGGVNIKIDLHNESGTQVEAQTTGSTFDGESYVVGVVLKAISTNKNGMRNIIKGVATT